MHCSDARAAHAAIGRVGRSDDRLRPEHLVVERLKLGGEFELCANTFGARPRRREGEPMKFQRD
jgi:hypothetical protein